MATLENSYVLFARLCVELFQELPHLPSDESHGEITTFEKQFLRKCQIELENSSPKTEQLPLVYVDESNYWSFIKTLRVLAEVFKNLKITETTRKVLMNPIFPPEKNTDAMNIFLSSIGKLADLQFSDGNFNQLVQSCRDVEMESNNYNEEVRLRKVAEDALATKKEEAEMMERSLESYKEEVGKFQSQAQALKQKHEAELQLMKETEMTVAMEHDYMRWKAEKFERDYKEEVILSKETEIALDKERKELEEVRQLLQTCLIEQENLNSQVITWQDMHDQESFVRKETEDALSKEKHERKIVKGLVELYRKEADAMRHERDNALKTVQEIMDERQPPPSFFCPITQDIMKDPHMAADGFTYEAEGIRKWLSTGHQTSPMTNLKLAHLNLIPNRALRSAIEELV